MHSVRKKILWLVSWYPDKNDRLNGDFIQRHARAAAIENDIHVIHVTEAAIENNEEIEWNKATGLTEQIIYFKKRSSLFSKFIKQYQWFNLYKAAIKKYISQNGLPHCVHVHVPWKAGLVALWIKKKYNLPYIVTEHWGIYNEIVEDNYFKKPIYFKKGLQKILSEAVSLISVSIFLGKGIQKHVMKKDYAVIPNVTDTSLFYYSEKKYSKFTFIHVSNMIPLKNVEGILDAFKKLVFQNSKLEAQLIMVGNREDMYVKLAQQAGLLNKNIFFKGEISYREVSEEMKLSHCLILNSNMENSPCVIGEALCTGLPVIATKVGGVPELVSENNSILIQPQNDEELKNAMLTMVQQHQAYNGKDIAAKASERFGYSAIATAFSNLYNTTRQ